MGRRKYSPTARAYALESGSYAIYRKARAKLLKENHLEFLESKEYWEHIYLPDYDVCRCLWRSAFARGYRLRKRLEPMILDGAWFLTLTFNDSVLASTTPVTRRKYVRRYLKSLAVNFVANKDFGSRNEREHYHAVVSLPYDLDAFALVHLSDGAHSTCAGWVYGFSNWEKIAKPTDDDPNTIKRVSRYLAKLQNHALKETASDEVMIYSRSKNNG